MQKLEQDLGVTLFHRTPNKLSLNETGEFAAQKIMTRINNFTVTIKEFHNNHSSLLIGSVAQGPLYLVHNNNYVAIHHSLIDNNAVEEMLLEQQLNASITNIPPKHKNLDSVYFGVEYLHVNVEQFMEIAAKKEVCFADLANLHFLVLRNIGIWKAIIEQHIQGAKFLYQHERDTFSEITKYSPFSFFTTNLSKPFLKDRHYDNKVTLVITDEAAKVPFYMVFLKDKRKNMKELVGYLQENWPS